MWSLGLYADDCNAMFRALGGHASQPLLELGDGLIFKPHDLTPMSVLELLHLISSRRRLWYTGGTVQAGINTFMQLTFHATLTPVCLNSAVMHRTFPSMVLMNDSVLSSDAATLSPGKTL